MKTDTRRARAARMLRRRLFGMSLDEASFAKRGFAPGPATVRVRLEAVGHAFLAGYNSAVEWGSADAIAPRLASVERSDRGFAYEGAAMAFALLDLLAPMGRANRFTEFVHGPAEAHLYMSYVGSGWALARLHRSPRRWMRKLDPLLRWLVLDGFGFHEGYFRWKKFAVRAADPPFRSGYERHAFDQGLGRALWFGACADVWRVRNIVARLHPARHADLWSGVGLACTYAGGATPREMSDLVRAAGPFHPRLAQGAAFAAKARERAGNPAPHTETACRIFCGSSLAGAAAVTDDALAGLPEDGAVPRYEVWRARIAQRFGEAPVQLFTSFAVGAT